VWGCLDGDHTAWMIVDVDTRQEARAIVPPAFQRRARIVALNRFSIDDIDALMLQHRQHPA